MTVGVSMREAENEIDLPNFSVLVKGLDEWRDEHAAVITELRLLGAVQWTLGKSVQHFGSAPWLVGLDKDPNGSAAKVGVPVAPFPTWFRCTACKELGALDSGVFAFENSNLRKPHEARFFHARCRKKKPLAVPARFVLVCPNGHLDEFPYIRFVHRGGKRVKADHPRLRRDDRGGDLGANVEIECINCGRSTASRTYLQAVEVDVPNPTPRWAYSRPVRRRTGYRRRLTTAAGAWPVASR